jgi:ATP-dependent RNA helicase DDX54/DBP10
MAQFSVGSDETFVANGQKQRLGQLKWDKKKHKFVRSTLGQNNVKMIKGESGVRLPASFKSNV